MMMSSLNIGCNDDTIAAFNGLDHACSMNGMGFWNLTGHRMTPALFMDVMSKLPLERSGDWNGAITMDVSENYLGTLSKEDILIVVKCLKARPWLRVRMGYEVVVPRVMEALNDASANASGIWQTQLFVDQPWERQLGSAVYKLTDMLSKMNESSDSKHGLANTKLQQYENRFQAADKSLEYEMARAVAMFVKGTVVAANYKWKRVVGGITGDIDGLVMGKDGDDDVVVICECKSNMSSELSDAVDQVKANLDRWKRLIQAVSNPDPDLIDQDLIAKSSADIRNLRVRDLVGRKIILAVGGALYPENLEATISKHFGWRSWISVHMDGMSATHIHRIIRNVSTTTL